MQDGVSEAVGAPKSTDWNVALATWLKRETRVSNRWLTGHLHLGASDAVSRYWVRWRAGSEASKLVKALTTKVRG